MTDQWFIRKEGNQTGPFSFAQLQEKVKAGRLNESDLIRVEGFSDWQEASTVENLFNFQQVSPPLPGQTPKKGGMKRINLIAGGVLFGFILLLVVAFFLNDDSDSAEAPVVPATEVEVAAPPDINISDGNDLIPAPEEDGLEGVIRLELNAGGSLAKNELAERFLIYVLKDGYHASVYSHDLQTGTDKLLFGYDEYSDEGYYFPYKSSFALSP
ncbi:MAG: GYF domain-containing protein, partial [Dethiobacteria bacterium]|nr:GYF domain-containing protein [Dethiobacteria bacterium]